MALQIIKPYIHVEDANGNPYVGAKLYVYLPGTTTLAAIFSDAALSVALANPLAGAYGSDAAGNFPRAYIAAGQYKLRAETSAGVLIWQEDNIDTGLSSGSGALPIASGGTGGTTATAALANLGAASSSDVTALATTIAGIQTSLQNIVSVPQGYLTTTSLTPIILASVASATSIYYTPFLGNIIPIYDGTQFNATKFSELTLTLNSNHVLSTIYDCYVISNSGAPLLVTGPAWNNSAAGLGARGAGAGTAEITRTVGGLWTNANAMTARNGATTYAVAVNRGTYAGSIFVDGSAGQVTCHRAYGQSRKFGIWNAYNRMPIILQAGDATASWTYGTNTVRASNGAAANSLTTFTGLAEEFADIKLAQYLEMSFNNTTESIAVGIGYNATNAFTGTVANRFFSSGASIHVADTLTAHYAAPPSLGINTVTSCENSPSALTVTYNGTQTNHLLQAAYRG